MGGCFSYRKYKRFVNKHPSQKIDSSLPSKRGSSSEDGQSILAQEWGETTLKSEMKSVNSPT